MNVRFSDLPAQYLQVKDRVDSDLAEILNSGGFIGGKYVDQFERDFAVYTGVSTAVAVGNGTDALEIILEGSLPKGSMVALPANSFIATAEAVSRSGHIPYLLDVDESYNISPLSAEQALRSVKLDAVILVHLFGRPVSESVIQIFKSHDVKIFEDCAQAHGAMLSGRMVGSIGEAAAFSFFPGKNLGAFGDAGGICTSSNELSARFRRVRNHGRLSKYDHEIIGRNSRMDSIQAAVLSAKLTLLGSWNDARRKNAEIYRRELSNLPNVILPLEDEDGMHSVYHHFVIRTSSRDELKQFLSQQGIETGIHYPDAISETPAYASRVGSSDLSNSERFSKSILSLPIAEHLSEAEITFVSEKIREFSLE